LNSICNRTVRMNWLLLFIFIFLARKVINLNNNNNANNWILGSFYPLNWFHAFTQFRNIGLEVLMHVCIYIIYTLYKLIKNRDVDSLAVNIKNVIIPCQLFFKLQKWSILINTWNFYEFVSTYFFTILLCNKYIILTFPKYLH